MMVPITLSRYPSKNDRAGLSLDVRYQREADELRRRIQLGRRFEVCDGGALGR